MSLLSENIIPGNYGKIFETNAVDIIDLKRIKSSILSLNGVKEVIINSEIFPKEFTCHTSTLVKIEDIENKVKQLGFHVIPKGLFEL